MRILLVTILLSATFFAVNAQEKINWLSFEEAMIAQEKEPKKIMIDVYTSWCGWCKVMTKKTFTDPAVIAYVNKHFYAVKFDAETKDTIHAKGKDFTYIKEAKCNSLAINLLFGEMSYPTIVFIDEKNEGAFPNPGYKGPEDFLMLLKYYNENFYLEIDLNTYKEQSSK